MIEKEDRTTIQWQWRHFAVHHRRLTTIRRRRRHFAVHHRRFTETQNDITYTDGVLFSRCTRHLFGTLDKKKKKNKVVKNIRVPTRRNDDSNRKDGTSKMEYGTSTMEDGKSTIPTRWNVERKIERRKEDGTLKGRWNVEDGRWNVDDSNKMEPRRFQQDGTSTTPTRWNLDDSNNKAKDRTPTNAWLQTQNLQDSFRW